MLIVLIVLVVGVGAYLIGHRHGFLAGVIHDVAIKFNSTIKGK